MKIHDISMTIENSMKVYKNKVEKRPELINVRNHEMDGMYESKIEMNLHTGTHMDAPLHMIEGGVTIDNIDLNKLITKCKVIDFTEIEDVISAKDLMNKNIEADDFILFKTRNAYNDTFDAKFIYLGSDAASVLAKAKIKGVGIDSLGIERSQTGHITHKLLFDNDIIIVEGLDLKNIEEGEYTLIALPLKIKNADASPIRAVLIEGNIIV